MATSDSEKLLLLDQLADEFAERFRRGERPALSEYVQRYPHLATDIRDLFPAMVEIEKAERDVQATVAPALVSSPLTLQQVGDYRILREIGRGGMGVVYEAEQVSLGRRVALKILPLAASKDDKSLERFRREARAAARLHHTNIVPVFDVGQEGDVCFYAMQFIQGQGLDQIIQELRGLKERGALESRPKAPDEAVHESRRDPTAIMDTPHLSTGAKSILTGRYKLDKLDVSTGHIEPTPPSSGVLPGRGDASSAGSNRRPYYQSVAQVGYQVATALAFAHARGVIHRDIKPSNLLLDASGVVWVTDFGLAKSEDNALTNTGELLGTLRYMAPERFGGICDGRSDVYALGLTLHEMLTLRPAFDAPDALQLIQKVQHQEPVRPRSVDARIPRDLETVVLKAIDKDPDRRYSTPDALAEDLRRFLADEPIQARRISYSERATRWCRRNPAVAVLSFLVLVSMAVGTAVSMSFALRARIEALEANIARMEAFDAAEDAREQAQKADRNAEETSRMVAQLCLDRGQRAENDGDFFGAMLWYTEPLARKSLSAAQQLRTRQRLGAYWRYGARPTLRLLLTSKTPIDESTTDVEEDTMAWAEEKTVTIWDLTTGKAIAVLEHPGKVSYVVHSPDHQHLLTLVTIAEEGINGRGEAWIWATPQGKLIKRIPISVSGENCWALFNNKGTQFLVGNVGGGLAGTSVKAIVDIESGKELQRLDDEVQGTVMYWDTHTVLTTDSRQVQNWDLQKHVIRYALPHRYGVDLLNVDLLNKYYDGRQFVTTSSGRNAYDAQEWRALQRIVSGPLPDKEYAGYVWDAETGRLLHVLSGDFPIQHVEFSEDGRQIVTAGGLLNGQQGAARVWDAKTGEVVRNLPHPCGVLQATFTYDSRRVLTTCSDRTVRVWDGAGDLVAILPHAGTVKVINSNRSDRQIVTVAEDGVRVWDLATERPRSSREELRFTLQDQPMWIAQNGQTMYHSGPDGSEFTYDCTVWPWKACFDSQARHLSTFSPKGNLRVWEIASNKLVYSTSPDGTEWKATYSPQGNKVAFANSQGGSVFEIPSGRVLLKLSPNERVLADSFSGDGMRLLTVREEGIAQVWDLALKEVVLQLPFEDELQQAIFSPDSQLILLVTGSRQTPNECQARLYRVSDGKAEPVPQLGGSVVAKFSPHSNALVLANAGSVNVWNCEPPGFLGASSIKHGSDVVCLAVSLDGKQFATATNTGIVRIWDMQTLQPVCPPMLHASCVSSVSFSPDGRSLACFTSTGTARVWDVESGQPLTPILYHPEPVIAARFEQEGQELWTGCPSGKVFRWDLRADIRPADELLTLARYHQSSRLDETGLAVPYNTAELTELASRVKAIAPGISNVTQELALDWHLRQAMAAAREEKWAAVLTHQDAEPAGKAADASWWLTRGKAEAHHFQGFAAGICLLQGLSMMEKPQRQEYHQRQAALAWEADRFRDVLYHAGEALKLGDVEELWIMRSRALFRLGRIPEAIASLDPALEREPDDEQLLNIRACLYAAKQDWPKALADLKQAAGEEEPSTDLLALTALFQFASGDRKGGTETCKKLMAAMKLGLNEGVNARIENRPSLFLCRESLPGMQQAADILTRLSESIPGNVIIAELQGCFAYRLGKYDEALRCQRICLRELQDVASKAWNQFFLAMTLWQLKQPTEARTTLAAAKQTMDAAFGQLDLENQLRLKLLREEAEELILGR